MCENRKSFILIWKIKNFSFCFDQTFSPVFNVQALLGTKWRLLICPFSSNFKNCVACYIKREQNDFGPDPLELEYELSFLAVDGSVLHSEKSLKKVNYKGSIDHLSALHVKRDEVYLLKKDLFIPDDTISICCRMWDTQKLFPQLGRCFAETRIETACKSFVGTTEKFSYVEPKEIYPFCIESSSSENFLSSMNLHVAADGKLNLKIKLTHEKSKCMCRCKIFILDVLGNKVKSGQGECHDKETHSVSLTLPKEHLMENKAYYLPNNVLTIECEIIFPTGKTTENVQDPEYGFDYQDIKEFISNAMKTNLCSKEHLTKSVTTLKDDLNSLFREGILCDTKLRTGTETFPTHKAVLSARSPVFKSMFTTDMAEKASNYVDIDDLDADTVRRMLKFMYLDTLDDLKYENAKSLYFAADKYNIVSLRYGCLNFLKQNILIKNCLDILLLADKHQDRDLKNAIHNYIARNDIEVLFSDEWKNLEKNQPQLTTEVLRVVYMRNRRS
ncbi:TD and POZ domain-containing protein 1 [Araneus ventricosus]|uniref:TD and POZ domain-containing protein 1 n=1 Tax=Araneus ventricosus TaxID=182803 RepID=A0A4Y2R457_ARAVE|nr:TD and POZ domain-containing protein 1 [Araneus ventricosus]